MQSYEALGIMTDPTNPPGSNVRDTAEVVRGIVEAVPVYEDAVQPAAKELGKGLETVAKTINVCLAPLRGLVWGWDRIEGFLHGTVAEKLSETPTKEIIEPKPHVAGPAIEALRFTGYEESLRDLYANLLAASMDARTAFMAHPSFVEIIKQLTPDEARLLEYFSTVDSLPVIDINSGYEDGSMGFNVVAVNMSLFGRDANCEHAHLTPSYIDNLSRLGLVIIPPDRSYAGDDAYEELENYPSVIEIKRQIDSEEGRVSKIERNFVRITELGEQFINACVVDHRELQQPESRALPSSE